MQLLTWITDIPSLVISNSAVLLEGLSLTLEITITAIIFGIVGAPCLL